MSTEIVKATEALSSQEEVGQELDRLEATGDTQALNEVAHRAKAYQEYELRSGATERANHFGRIKIMAEARIGSIDLALHPVAKGTRLEFDETTISEGIRSLWRTLGMAVRGGQLDKAISRAEQYDTVSTHHVARELRDMGVRFYVYTEPLLKRYWELHEHDGLTIKEVETKVGMRLGTHLTRPGTEPQCKAMHRHRAERVAHVLGVDPHSLKTSEPLQTPKRVIRKARALPGGRLDKTYSLIRRALQELDATAGPSGQWGTGQAYDHLYKAEEIIGAALKRAPVDSPHPTGKTR